MGNSLFSKNIAKTAFFCAYTQFCIALCRKRLTESLSRAFGKTKKSGDSPQRTSVKRAYLFLIAAVAVTISVTVAVLFVVGRHKAFRHTALCIIVDTSDELGTGIFEVFNGALNTS